jgi:hypothetical protein
MTYAVALTLKSRNSKVGPMPVSTSTAHTCPDACPLKANGCYAEAGPLGMYWRAVTKAGDSATGSLKTQRGEVTPHTWDSFCDTIATLPEGTLWRHNQAGDLPGLGDKIDEAALTELVDANAGKRGFTYTHKPITNAHNAHAIADANAKGFTINLSANTLAEADTLADASIAPVVVVLSDTVHGNVPISTPAGRKVAVCPATYREDVSCASCGLCQRQDRKVIVGFPAHGASHKRASKVANS